MKTNIILAALLLGLSTAGNAQSWSHFYNEEYGQRTVEPLFGAPYYVMSETRYDASGAQDHGIHFTRYDQAGNIIPPADVTYNAQNVEEYNVDLTNIGNKFLLTSSYSPIGSGRVFVSNMIVDANGNIAMPSVLMESTDPTYQNLYAMDAVYDPAYNQFVICGMATKSDYFQTTTKVAFVGTINAGTLTTTNLMFYESSATAAGSNDFDVANRIVLNSTGRYYITGSENVFKGNTIVMGIRNMLIDPTTLNPIWSNPISFNNTYSNENSVDMAETIGASGGNEFFTLVNSDAANKWYFLRIDPATGVATNTFIETVFSYRGYGHNISLGNSPNELVITGMKYRSQSYNCYSQDQEATPFAATVNVTNPLGTFVNHVEYYTVVSNSPYWSIGGAYQPSPGFYPNPIYLNNFADREAVGMNYSVVTPIKGISGVINTKYLDVNSATNNGCDDLTCSYGLDFNDYSTYPTPPLTNYPPSWQNNQGAIRPRFINPFNSLDCASGYYKGESTTGVQNMNEGSLSIYPNPATDKISVGLNSNYSGKDVEITLCDIAGKRIATLYKGHNESTTITIALPGNVTTGIYLLQINAEGNNTTTKKLTINK